MSAQQAEGWSRREFLGGLTLAGMAGLLGVYPRLGAAAPGDPFLANVREEAIPT